MDKEDVTRLIDFFEDSFSNDIYERELRLSPYELDIFKITYPKAVINLIDGCSDDKHWYKITMNPKRSLNSIGRCE